jgi:hypothetical protein
VGYFTAGAFVPGVVGVVQRWIVVTRIAGRARGDALFQFLNLELNLILPLVFHGFPVLFGFFVFACVTQRENVGCHAIGAVAIAVPDTLAINSGHLWIAIQAVARPKTTRARRGVAKNENPHILQFRQTAEWSDQGRLDLDLIQHAGQCHDQCSVCGLVSFRPSPQPIFRPIPQGTSVSDCQDD